MKKIYLFIMMALIMFFAFGCGHNGMVYLNGVSAQLGYNPETNQIGAGYFNGETLLVGSKENTNVEFELDQTDGVDADGKTISVNRIKKVKYSTGIQINGYMVELAEASPDFAAKVIQLMKENGKVKKFYVIEDGKLKEITEQEYNNSEKDVIKIDGENLSIDAKKNTK